MSQRLDPSHYAAPFYYATAYKQQYEQWMLRIDCLELVLTPNCMVSCYQRATARPKKARCRMGQNGASNYICKRCREQGHNSRNKNCHGARNGKL
jgi:hypothetical protein